MKFALGLLLMVTMFGEEPKDQKVGEHVQFSIGQEKKDLRLRPLLPITFAFHQTAGHPLDQGDVVDCTVYAHPTGLADLSDPEVTRLQIEIRLKCKDRDLIIDQVMFSASH